MITEKEIESVNLSPTKKDFYQIWNELLEVSTKLSSRWSPVSTNESDPGIVLLKVLAAVGDKLNYNIDKNILEAFMPSATQQESMRKLCDMMGYSIKYFKSATTTATIQYTGEWPDSFKGAEIVIPRFSTLKDTDDEIHYVTLEPVSLGENNRANVVDCIEGQICTCENSANTNGFITMAQLDSNLRYYLPESQIAENGIFITSATMVSGSDSGSYEISFDSEEWLPVENINSTPLNTRCYKFCFDSKRSLPYLQFPADISNLINDGLLIKYIRTNGINGNIAARTLTSISKPDDFSTDLNIDDFIAVNTSAATNGANIESINDAYNNYKKTIGTFDTLVTCRDYMNKIYQLVEDNDTKIDTTPLVSNIIVSDIRDDINRSFTLCEFSDYGIKYVDKVITEGETEKNKKDRINHFDIVLYPFKTIASNVSENAYNNSFKYSLENSIKIEEDIASYKTISHSIKYPVSTDIVCIKNYLKLNAKITTVNKVNLTEENAILSNIYTKIYTKFNARQLDFGEAIPFDEILECIETADTRIKNVSLDEPILYTAFETADNNEYSIESSTDTDLTQAKRLYNKLALRNILAGKIALFNYNEDFKYEYSEKNYSGYNPIYPSYDPSSTSSNKLIKLESEFKIDFNPSSSELSGLDLKLLENEVIQFRAPAYYTEVTYPAYVNYYINLSSSSTTTSGQGASFIPLGSFLDSKVTTESVQDHWDILYGLRDRDEIKITRKDLTNITIASAADYEAAHELYGAIWTADNQRIRGAAAQPQTAKYCLDFAGDSDNGPSNFIKLIGYITSLALPSSPSGKYAGIFKPISGPDASFTPGYLITNDYYKYKSVTALDSNIIKYDHSRLNYSPVKYYYIQSATEKSDGLGKNTTVEGISENCEYQLKDDEYLLINYTEASSDDSTTQDKTVKNIIYGKGTIIKPNFNLADSKTKKTVEKINFTKDSGYSFVGYSPMGMYTLGATDQIEIRKKSELILGEIKSTQNNDTGSTYVPMNIYWDRLEEDKLEKDNDGIVHFFEGDETSYTLKPGEYFYFTDANKLDMSYYGAGTEIIRTPNFNIDKVIDKTIKKLSADELLSGGINSIPWWKISSDRNNHITFKEYQYITLSKDDTLESITLKGSESSITNEYIECSAATYRLQGTPGSLPSIMTRTGEGSDSWEVRSLLQFNMGPDQSQLLRSNSTTYPKITESITLYYDNSSSIPITPTTGSDGTLVPISVKSNYPCQLAYEVADVRVAKEDVSTGEQKWINDFKLKVFEDSPLVIYAYTENGAKTPVPVPVHNFGDTWTKISTRDYGYSDSSYLELNVNLPTNTYGLVMMYVIAEDTESPKKSPFLPYLNYPVSGSTLKIFNYYESSTSTDESSASTDESDESWWAGYYTEPKYYLKHGINVIKVEASGQLKLYADTNKTATIILSDLDIININKNNGDPDLGINLAGLNYYYTGSAAATYENRALELLKDINQLDAEHVFYYNARLENSECLDINTALDIKGQPIETLATPSILYDYNNVNNKFVISQIDTNYMKKYGISIAKSSKRTY